MVCVASLLIPLLEFVVVVLGLPVLIFDVLLLVLLLLLLFGRAISGLLSSSLMMPAAPSQALDALPSLVVDGLRLGLVSGSRSMTKGNRILKIATATSTHVTTHAHTHTRTRTHAHTHTRTHAHRGREGGGDGESGEQSVQYLVTPHGIRHKTINSPP